MSAAVLSSVRHAVCKASVCVSVIFSAQSASNRRSGICFHHRKLFFFYPWGVSFEAPCITLLCWILNSLIHSVQTNTDALPVSSNMHFAAPLWSRVKVLRALGWSTQRHIFRSMVLFHQRQCTNADIAVHICQSVQTICHCVRSEACVPWSGQTTCRPHLSLCKLSYQEPTRFSWHGANELAVHKQVDCYFFVPLLIRQTKGEL